MFNDRNSAETLERLLEAAATHGNVTLSFRVECNGEHPKAQLGVSFDTIATSEMILDLVRTVEQHVQKNSPRRAQIC